MSCTYISPENLLFELHTDLVIFGWNVWSVS